MEKIPIDKYRLRFPPEIEKDFLEENFNKSLLQMRIGIILTAVLFALFGILDAWITPEVKIQAWTVRFAVVVPGCIIGLAFSFTPYFKKYAEVTIFSMLVLAGGGVIALLLIVRSPLNYFHFGGLFLVIMYTYILGNIRFIYTCAAAWTVIAAYEMASYAMGQMGSPVFVTDNIFLHAANVGGMIFGYNREMYIRRDFFYNRTVKELEEEKHLLEKERLQQAVDTAAKSLKESEARFRALAESTTAAIFIHQGERFLYVNPAGERMSGYSNEELLQRDFWTFIHPDYQELVRERGRARVRGEEIPQEYEFKFIRKNGDERWVVIATAPIVHKETPAIIATLFDITDWKNAEAAKTALFDENTRQYQQRIAEKQRHLLEKEKLLRDLHDGIGGITTNISILSELARKCEDQERARAMLGTIAQLAREGVAEIRSFMQSVDEKDLNWHALAVELRKQGTTMVEPHQIRFSAEVTIDEIREQPGSLLWINLLRIYKEALTNVIKHSHAATVSVAFRINRTGIFLSVQDDGQGWNAASPAGRGKQNMAKRALEIGGKVDLSSAANGTRVSVSVPLPLKYPAMIMDM